MRFMMLVIPKADENAGADFVPPVDLIAKMTKYNESLAKAGIVLALDGLHPPVKGTRVKFAGGKPKTIDGPFTESKELIGGAWGDPGEGEEEGGGGGHRGPGRGGGERRRGHGGGKQSSRARGAP